MKINKKLSRVVLASAVLIICFFLVSSIVSAVPAQSVSPSGRYAYVANSGAADPDNTVSVVDTATNVVTATVKVGTTPVAIAVSSDGAKAYVANFGSNNVSVINTTTNTVTSAVPVGSQPEGVAISPDKNKGICGELFEQQCLCN